VYVCAVDNKLNLAGSGSVATELLTCCGKSLLEECNATFPTGITHGEVIAVNGGSLHCKKVYFISLPDWIKDDVEKV